MLDTNVVASLINDVKSPALPRLTALDRRATAISAVVEGEVRFRLEKRPSSRLANDVEAFLLRMPVLPLDSVVAGRYGQLRAYLEKRGQTIGGNDLWIAAHALTVGATMVTDNMSEFARVPNLRVENWLRHPA